MLEKCCKCYEWKDKKDFVPLPSGATKPRCIACVEKQATIQDVSKQIESTSTTLSMLRERLNKLNDVYIEKPKAKETQIVNKVNVVQTVLKLHPRLPLGMKRGSDEVYYYYKDGSVKLKAVWDGKYGKYTSYKEPKTNQFKYIGLTKLKQEIFGNISKSGV